MVGPPAAQPEQENEVDTHPNTDAHPVDVPPTPPRAYVPRPDSHSALPAGVSKAQAIATVSRALQALAMPSAIIGAWRLIADQTETSAWLSVTQTPMNFRKARDLARELGVTARHWRRIETQLETVGVLYRATTDNGFRGKAAGGALTFGLSLEPALAQYEAFATLAARPEQQAQARKQALGKIRALRKRLRALDHFDPMDETLRAELGDLEQKFRPTRLADAPQFALERYLSELTRFEEVLRNRGALDLSQPDEDRRKPAGCSDKSCAAHYPTGAAPDLASDAGAGAFCPSGAAQSPSTEAKMSAAADSHVRCQYNLEYNNKRLNAHSVNDYLEEAPVPVPLRPKTDSHANHTGLEKLQERAEPPSTGIPVGQTLKAQEPRCELRSSESAPKPSSMGYRLPSGHRLNLIQITRIFDHSGILEDIKAHKVGSPCAKLDPQHIWDRFRRYNLKRDKHILPIAALRAFIKRWIPDGPEPYLALPTASDQSATRSAPKQPGSGQTTGKASHPKAKASREEILAFYADAINSGRHIPQTMISPGMRRDLIEAGMIE